MAASDWAPGYELSVTIDGVEYPFKSITYNPKSKLINRSNSKYQPGFTIQRGGVKSLTFSGSGPYKEGELPLTIGEEYTWLYKPTAGHLGFEFLGVLENLSARNDVEDGPTTDITVQNSDEFDPIFV